LILRRPAGIILIGWDYQTAWSICGFVCELKMVTEVVREGVLGECRKSGNALGPSFFDQHLAVVADYGKALA